MSQKQNGVECNAICWLIAAFAGVFSMIMLYMLGDFGALQAIFTGGLAGTLLGVVLSVFVCRGPRAAHDLTAEEKPAQRYARQAAEDKARRGGVAVGAAGGAVASGTGGAAAAPTATHADAPAAEASTAAATHSTPSPLMSSPVKPSAPLAGQAELASRKGDWKYDSAAKADKAVAAKKADAAPKAEAVKPVAADKKSEAIPAGETAAPAVAPKGDAAPAPAGGGAAEKAPQLFTSAPAEGADDLKLISGVGPKLEQTLNDLGIYRFEQVAKWGASEIAWVDARLRFKGRIERDDWMSQAKILAEGGETEFSRKKK